MRLAGRQRRAIPARGSRPSAETQTWSWRPSPPTRRSDRDCRRLSPATARLRCPGAHRGTPALTALRPSTHPDGSRRGIDPAPADRRRARSPARRPADHGACSRFDDTAASSAASRAARCSAHKGKPDVAVVEVGRSGLVFRTRAARFTVTRDDRAKPSSVAFAMHLRSGINGGTMTTGKRGFASMDRNRQREIASKGGKLAHLRGMAHEWTSEEAREAGRKGGAAVRQRKPAPDPQRQDQQ